MSVFFLELSGSGLFPIKGQGMLPFVCDSKLKVFDREESIDDEDAVCITHADVIHQDTIRNSSFAYIDMQQDNIILYSGLYFRYRLELPNDEKFDLAKLSMDIVDVEEWDYRNQFVQGLRYKGADLISLPVKDGLTLEWQWTVADFLENGGNDYQA